MRVSFLLACYILHSASRFQLYNNCNKIKPVKIIDIFVFHHHFYALNIRAFVFKVELNVPGLDWEYKLFCVQL